MSMVRSSKVVVGNGDDVFWRERGKTLAGEGPPPSAAMPLTLLPLTLLPPPLLLLQPLPHPHPYPTMSKESMDTSVIDLCDSDVEDGAAAPSFNAVAAAAVAARKTADADDDDDDGEHSSSSSDDDLWNAGGSSQSRMRRVDILLL